VGVKDDDGVAEEVGVIEGDEVIEEDGVALGIIYARII